ARGLLQKQKSQAKGEGLRPAAQMVEGKVYLQAKGVGGSSLEEGEAKRQQLRDDRLWLALGRGEGKAL
ncbi:hypothetical protein H0E87_031259, partial [Populus deltoides]